MQDALPATRASGRRVLLTWPTFTECPQAGCGFDELHDSGINPSCSYCGGLGRTVVWSVSAIQANVRLVTQTLVTWGSVPPGVREGDTLISFGPRDEPMVQRVLDTKDAYIGIDGNRLRPVGISTAGMGRAQEYVAVLRAYTATFTATGV